MIVRCEGLDEWVVALIVSLQNGSKLGKCLYALLPSFNTAVPWSSKCDILVSCPKLAGLAMVIISPSDKTKMDSSHQLLI